MKGFTGKQGVLIPAANIDDLMLRAEVIDAVATGKFHIYPVSTVSEGLEILTGASAGTREANGKFPEGTIFARVDDRLRVMAETLREFE